MNITQIGTDCVGCYNCENVCVHKAVRMYQDKEGFFYPVVDIDICNNCGICLQHCPQTMDHRNLGNVFQVQSSYNAISKLRKFYKRSASGGAFVTLAYQFLSQHRNAAVCGVTYDEGRVHHVVVRNINDLPRLQGSKYVQSQLDDLFVSIKSLLKQGGYVLFSGTPCQIAALYAFLNNRSFDNLITIDLICHGVPSPKFFERDLILYRSSVKNIKDVQFRTKHPLFKSKSDFCLKLRGSDKYFTRTRTCSLNQDPYFSLFSKGHTLRWACYRCHYACLQRVSDITIGDCDSWARYPHFHPDEATSAIIINTSVGHSLWESAKTMFDFIDLDLQTEAAINSQLQHPFTCPTERKTIYEELDKLTIQQIRSRYAKPKSLRSIMGRMMYAMLPYRISKRIAKIILNQ